MVKIEILYSLLGISVLFGLCSFIMLKNCEKYADFLIKEVSKRDKLNKQLEHQLKPFQDEYFKGLDNVVIAELAKKSIRITAEYCKLENILRDIKEICLQQNLKADLTACEILEKIKEL